MNNEKCVETLEGVQNCFAVKDASSEIYPMRQFALLLLYNAGSV